MPKNLFEYKIKCFFCNLVLKYNVKNKQRAIWDARKRGWVLGEYNKCPKCKKKPKSELNKKIIGEYF